MVDAGLGAYYVNLEKLGAGEGVNVKLTSARIT